MILYEKRYLGSLLSLLLLLIFLEILILHNDSLNGAVIYFTLPASNYLEPANFPSHLAMESSLPWWDRTTLTDCEDPSLKLASEV